MSTPKLRGCALPAQIYMMETANQAQVAGFVCVALSLFVLVGRIIICQWHRKPFDLSSYLVVFSTLTLALRTITNSISLSRGTANDAILHADDPSYLSAQHLQDIKIGSILSLLSRVLLTFTLWFQVAILLLFYANITSGIRFISKTIRLAWASWTVSFVSIILATFLECHPFYLYWQVKPEPGQCVKAYTQLVLQGVSNAILDLMLLFIAYPLVTLKKRSWTQRISLYTLFLLGTFCIIITILRLVLVFQQGSSQVSRSLWASVQIIVSVFVANAPTIYGTLRTARRKGSQQPNTSTHSDREMPRKPSRHGEQNWFQIDEENISLSRMPLRLPRSPPPAVVILDEDSGMVAHNPTPPLPSRDRYNMHSIQMNSMSDVR